MFKLVFSLSLFLLIFLSVNSYATGATVCPTTVVCTSGSLESCKTVGSPDWQVDMGMGLTRAGTYQLVGAGYDGRYAFSAGGGAWCTYKLQSAEQTVGVDARNYAIRDNLVPNLDAGDWGAMQDYRTNCHDDAGSHVSMIASGLTPINPSACPFMVRSKKQWAKNS